jgi:plasmid stabilization system protein ParE
LRRLRRIATAIAKLAEHPCRYPIQQHGRREFSVEGHRIVYRVTPDTGANETAGDVLVVRVFGPGQSREVKS